MSTLRISNIEAKSVPASATIDEKVKITNSSGDTLVFIDGKTSGITTVGINTTDSNITFDANSNVVVTGIITATRFSGQITPTSLEIGSNIKLGNAGVITATSFVGSGANLTNLPTQVTITGNADNRVITGGSGTNLNGEANVQIDSGGRLSVGTDQASTQYSGASDLVIGNTTGEHGMTIISNSSNRGRIMFSDTYSANSGRYSGQILYDHQTETINWYSNYTNNSNVAMQLGGDENQLFVGIEKNATTYNNRSAFFHRGTDNFISITGASNHVAGIVFGDTIAANGGNYETYMHHTNSTNDFWIRVNQGNDNRHLKITQAGNVEIGNGNLVMASGHGIDFSATADGASGSYLNSEVLSDYERGRFEPRFLENGSTDSNYAWRYGQYVKIGNIVHVHMAFGISSLSGNFTTAFIGGLPFTMSSQWGTTDFNYVRPIGYSYASGYGDSGNTTALYMELNQTHGDKHRVVQGQGKGNVNQSSIGTSQRLAFQFSYPAA